MFTKILKDLNEVEMSYEEIFDTNKYNIFKGVTYVSSVSFIDEVVNKFIDSELIIGINDSNYLKNMNENIQQKFGHGIDLFYDLTEDEKEKVLSDKLRIRYAKLGVLIHSKIFLLENNETKETRVILGSANLTNSAFNDKVRQYEEVLIFDNSPLYEIFTKRYAEIYEDTEDFIPETIRNQYKEEKYVFVDKSELANIKMDLVCNNEIDLSYVPKDIKETIREIEKENSDEDNRNDEYFTNYMFRNIIKKDNSGKKFIPNLSKKPDILKRIVEISLLSNKENEKHERPTFIYNEEENTSILKDPFLGTEEIANELDEYSIAKSLENIEKFCETYTKYTIKGNENSTSKAYETILYTFLSPYLYLLKEQSLNPEDIPNFLVIGGRARSGKTNLLKYLVRLVNQNDKFFGFKEFDGNGNNPQRKIGEVLNAENSYPFFVDEVKQKFFMNDSGETLVKNVANEKRNHQPSMILTTNAHNNSYSSQVSRRIYYIEFNNAFPEDEKIAKCNLVYLDLLKNANDNLLRDFCFRIEKYIADNKFTYNVNDDFLRIAREIFTDYYKKCGRKMPKYFPDKIFNDTRTKNVRMWRTFFEQNKNNQDIFTTEGNILLFKTSSLDDENKKIYLNALSPSCIQKSTGIYTMIYFNLFLDWLNMKNPYILNSIFKPIFDFKEKIFKPQDL